MFAVPYSLASKEVPTGCTHLEERDLHFCMGYEEVNVTKKDPFPLLWINITQDTLNRTTRFSTLVLKKQLLADGFAP